MKEMATGDHSAERCNCIAKFGSCHKMSSVVSLQQECIVITRFSHKSLNFQLGISPMSKFDFEGVPSNGGLNYSRVVFGFLRCSISWKRWSRLIFNRKSYTCFRFVQNTMLLNDLERSKRIYSVSQKRATLVLDKTLINVVGFAKFFHSLIQQEIYNKTLLYFPPNLH